MMRAICSNRWRSTRPTIWVTNCVKHGKKSWCERRRTAKSRVCCVPPFGYSVPNSFCSASSYSHWNSFSGSNDLVNRPFGIRRAVELIFAAFSFQSTTAAVSGCTGAILHTQSLFEEDECDEFWWIGQQHRQVWCTIIFNDFRFAVHSNVCSSMYLGYPYNRNRCCLARWSTICRKCFPTFLAKCSKRISMHRLWYWQVRLMSFSCIRTCCHNCIWEWKCALPCAVWSIGRRCDWVKLHWAKRRPVKWWIYCRTMLVAWIWPSFSFTFCGSDHWKRLPLHI